MSRGPPQINGMVSLKVDNLTYRTTIDDLRKVFDKYGDVGDVYIPRDKYHRESRGFAFVRYHNRREAEDAIDGVDGLVIDGREIRVQEAKYGRPDDKFGNSNRHDRRSRGGRDSSRYQRNYRSRSRDRFSRRRSYRSRSRSFSRRRTSRSRSRNRRYSRSYDSKSRSRSRDRTSKTRRSSSGSKSPDRYKRDSSNRSTPDSRHDKKNDDSDSD